MTRKNATREHAKIQHFLVCKSQPFLAFFSKSQKSDLSGYSTEPFNWKIPSKSKKAGIPADNWWVRLILNVPTVITIIMHSLTSTAASLAAFSSCFLWRSSCHSNHLHSTHKHDSSQWSSESLPSNVQYNKYYSRTTTAELLLLLLLPLLQPPFYGH